MSKSKDWALSGFHGMGKGFTNNPNNNRQAVMQNMIANHLIELCTNRFEWFGLPDSVDPRYLELTLFQQAVTVFFKDEGTRANGYTNTSEFFCLPAAGGGMVNVQDVPTHFQVTAPNIDLNVHLETGKNCVPIFANYLRRPELDKVGIYSQKLATIDRTIEIAAHNLRRTKVISAPENMRPTYVNAIKQYDEGVMTIFGTEGFNPEDMISSIDVSGNPDALPRLRDEKNQIWNECMTMLGINNSNQDKRERLVASEVEANDEQVEATRYIALNARQYAAEQINALWPELKGEVWVDFRKPPVEETADDEGDGETEDEGKPKLEAVK